MSKPIVAIMYDFDKTLCTKDMQNYRFIPSLGMQVSEFWDYTNTVQHTENMDSVLAYMYAAVKISKESLDIRICTGQGWRQQQKLN